MNEKFSITALPNIKNEYLVNKSIRKKILMIRIIIQIAITVVLAILVNQLFIYIQMNDILYDISAKIQFDSKQFLLLRTVLIGVVIVLSTCNYLLNEKYIATRDVMVKHGSHYSDQYLKIVETLAQKKILRIYSDELKKKQIWFDYLENDTIVKRLGVEMEVIFRLDAHEIQVDFKKRTITYPYRESPCEKIETVIDVANSLAVS